MCMRNTNVDRFVHPPPNQWSASRLFEQFIDYQIDDLERHEDDNDPFQKSTVAILQEVFKKLQVLLDDLQTLPDIPEPFLQIERPLQPLIDPVEILVFPSLRRRIENI